MYKVIKHYKFIKTLNYAILNNASTNDILINVLTNYLNNINMDWDLKQHCIYYFKYIMNLIILVFIYINSKNILAANDAIEEYIFKYFKKLHNFVIYMQIFSQCCEKFKIFIDELNLHCNNSMK